MPKFGNYLCSIIINILLLLLLYFSFPVENINYKLLRKSGGINKVCMCIHMHVTYLVGENMSSIT